MAFDVKKADKHLYLPKTNPEILTVPPMRFMAVSGQGDPNARDGQYKQAIEMLYTVSYTIKMSKMGQRKIDGYFDFVVPPLEGFWSPRAAGVIDHRHKSAFSWISCIRLPDFVTRENLAWAAAEASKKKKLDCSKVEFLTIAEGLCVQTLHIGSFDDEPRTIALMDAYLAQQGYINDFSSARLHHEIYLSDPRRVPMEKWKTVIRHPIRKA